MIVPWLHLMGELSAKPTEGENPYRRTRCYSINALKFTIPTERNITMNKSDLKNFAINARLELLQRVSDRAALYGVDEKRAKDKSIVPTGTFHKLDGTVLTASEAERRDELIARVYQIGYRPAMEAAAYTWFNRFIAVKYMQEHGLLPVAQRVFPDAAGAQPQILREAQDVSLTGVDMAQVIALLDANRTDELYKLLLIALCNALSAPLPGMFEEISRADELLFPDALLKADSVLGEMAKLDADCWSEIQVIGWLYQYYNTQLKDETFELLKKNVKITKDRIGAATQLFTPEWIVNYMVENSLGRLWLEGHPDANLRIQWRYFMDEAPQSPEVVAQLAEIRAPYASIQPEQIAVLDPCMGSGHILVYAFDVLMQIYRSLGYTDRDAAASIVENNLYGLDIDDRAAQLAYFAVMMKACEYDHRFLRRGVQPHVCAIQECAALSAEALGTLGAERPLAEHLLKTFADAKEYGSLLHVDLTVAELERLSARLAERETAAHDNLLSIADSAQAITVLKPLVKQAMILARQYDAVITNPPYMGASGMNEKLSRFVKENYPDSKSDLFAAFIERCGELMDDNGYQAMITQHAWMFLSSYEKLRGKLQMRELISMAHLGARAFEEIGGEVVQTAAFVMEKVHIPGYKGSYARLIEPTTQDGKEKMFLAETNRYTAQQDNFKKIPGAPIAYWMSKAMAAPYNNGEELLGDIASPCAGLATGDNDVFQRIWYEVSFGSIGFGIIDVQETKERVEKWYPCNSGGAFRKWSTDDFIVVNWSNNGAEIKAFRNVNGKLAARPQNTQWYFKEGLTWNKLSSSRFAVKYKRAGYIFDDTSRSAFPSKVECLKFIIGLLCSNVTFEYLKVLNPTMSFTNGDLVRIPVRMELQEHGDVESKVDDCISISRADWNSFETSWDFKKHPMI